MRRTNALKWLISMGVMAFAACSDPEPTPAPTDATDGIPDTDDSSDATDDTDRKSVV